MNQQIVRIDLPLPDRWCGWRPGEGPRVAARAAAALTDSPVAETRLRSALEAVDRAVVEQHSHHVRVGAWVPDLSGDVVGGLACEILAGAADGLDPAAEFLGRVKRKIGRSRRTATRLIYHSASVRTVPAGGAVVTLRSHGAHRHEVVWTVFPAESRGAVELRFDTRAGSRFEELVAHAEAVVRDLRVTFARPLVGRVTVPPHVEQPA
ncbi:hypothetical protein [Cellulomonas triticagri]|uniref:Uncharacterized protein n=1 Tax=Cellulomonas triticagri TaxID=2483352 RepID=A0A3M2J9B6_9CELL|nr:hypothetical protein [Cellulomonas triticagri]RMI08661.1 hypothetical protein EBM89_13610 [Cellulomonas triticagri]